ncbi:PREDICTED: protein lin-37 homolog isoform X2 [Myotis brandtii]|uniref:protein lin-37 homolog isoform X2 n=1 Tax=Myotis brandtii TaxID=109478 RepID=UPI0003BB8AE5|nr:PREDICTED: protein lin-37 homolog isoform X2 [Myotis brandtii]
MGPHQRGARGAGGGGSRRSTLLRAEELPRTKLIFDGLRLPLPLTCDARPFWAPLTQLARLQTKTMFPVKVKVEKSGSPRAGQSISPSVLPGSEHCAKAPTSWKRRANTSQELEMAKARNQLDAVLQCLLEKSHMDRERLDEEARKTPSDTHSKDCSIVATGKRPSARFPHQRRKKRREMDDGLAEGGPQRSNTYVIKLFDRSVDLAQFSENTPLYPICRAWMRNSPTVREHERSPSSPLPPLPEDEEGSEVTTSKSRDVYKLPPPTAPGPPGDACRSRIPSPLQPETQGTPEDEPSEPSPSPSTLIYRNMQRWKRIRQRWKEASHRNQLRYSESMKILREMYERQ